MTRLKNCIFCGERESILRHYENPGFLILFQHLSVLGCYYVKRPVPLLTIVYILWVGSVKKSFGFSLARRVFLFALGAAAAAAEDSSAADAKKLEPAKSASDIYGCVG